MTTLSVPSSPLLVPRTPPLPASIQPEHELDQIASLVHRPCPNCSRHQSAQPPLPLSPSLAARRLRCNMQLPRDWRVIRHQEHPVQESSDEEEEEVEAQSYLGSDIYCAIAKALWIINSTSMLTLAFNPLLHFVMPHIEIVLIQDDLLVVI